MMSFGSSVLRYHQVLDKGAVLFALCAIATTFVGPTTQFTLQSRYPMMSDVQDNNFYIFAHMVDAGWITECADLSGPKASNSSGIYNLDDSGSCDLTGFNGGATCGSELSGDDAMDAKELDMACGPDLPAVSCDYDMSDMSWKHAHFSDKQVVNGLLVSIVDICVDAAFSMRPVDHPKAMSSKVSAGNFTHGDIAINKTDHTWQQARESFLHCSLKSGLVALSYLDAMTISGAHLEFELTELGDSTLLADDFRGCAPATLLRRVGSVEKTCSNSGSGRFPPDEPFVHRFFTAERKQDATSSCLEWFLGALSFCMHVIFMDQIGQVVQCHRCLEAITKDVSLMICQASSLKVDELQMLRTKFFHWETMGQDLLKCNLICSAFQGRLVRSYVLY